MNQTKTIDTIRRETLNRIDRAERNYKLAFAGGVLIEGLFFALFFWLADLSNRTHLLLLIATVATYTILLFGLVALGAHISRNTLRILKAIELLDERGNT